MNYTVYSTSPRIKYSPQLSCKWSLLGRCGERYDPWEMKAYVSAEGRRRTYHSAPNHEGDPYEGQRRELTASFEGMSAICDIG